MNREDIIAYTAKKYDAKPDHPWREYPDYEVLRHNDDQKWYGLFMYLPRKKLGLDNSEDYIDVMNLKCDPDLMELLRMSPGILPAYHMSRKHWITVLLDGSVSDEQILSLLDLSFELTASKKELERYKLTPPKDWLVPANPKYYDVVHAFDHTDIISWKQGAGIREGDTIFLYVAAPYSSILFQCKVLETGIPYHDVGAVHIKYLMTVQLERRFAEGEWSFDRLKEYGVYAVRGPRNLPKSIREEMDRN